ncbi:hypothetical protein [Blastochloris tepida]|uniref:Transcription regulator PadR N-terminal domain-containing protein n=1 Tax=Blastochloris tepida TaxID=2233851 RepID=A0A348FYK2_9HYPH|nr:hypothetical protein [Blastochloris tepida]BBF92385.1 hypothetical protein BLTE_10700 [Blastochloris tepida]
MNGLPLNGEKTHPLSEHALGVLRRLRDRGPVEAYQINPGVRNRLTRGPEAEWLAAPFRGPGDRQYYCITKAGRAALESSGG